MIARGGPLRAVDFRRTWRAVLVDQNLELSAARVDTMHMKRTNLVLREDILHEAVRLSGERTYSRTVDRALLDFVNRMKAHRILELAGSGAWKGDIGETRKDPPRRSVRRRHAAR
jgi:Bacterial antitoxin of type II TA system, VapB